MSQELLHYFSVPPRVIFAAGKSEGNYYANPPNGLLPAVVKFSRVTDWVPRSLPRRKWRQFSTCRFPIGPADDEKTVDDAVI